MSLSCGICKEHLAITIINPGGVLLPVCQKCKDKYDKFDSIEEEE